ncbi:MAG: PAS domain-containing sensor histidine kinase [Thermoleophilia bacterium]
MIGRVGETPTSPPTDYREVFDKANDGLLIHDADTGEILDANPRMCEMYGYTTAELCRLDIAAISSNEPPFTESASRRNIRRAVQTEPQLFEWVAKAKDGSLFWVEVNLKMIRIGGRDRLLSIVRDISERRRAEEETERLRSALAHVSRLTTLGELSASLAHELNQPLAAILANAQAGLRIMQTDCFDRGEIQDILADIAVDDVRAGEVIRRMRELLRDRRLTSQLVDVRELIADVFGLVRSDAILAQTKLEARVETGLPPVLGDPVQLQQVILNLVVNSLHVMKEWHGDRRRVTVVALPETPRSVRIEVRDTGPGIPEALGPRVFEPFFTTKPQGLGLGLSICRTLVEAHGGKIQAEFTSEPGAKMVVTLPSGRRPGKTRLSATHG